jgi:hypothetical protein
MYYASAETLMLRSIGIPARMAVGFAQGTVDEGNLAERYIVTYQDAHAWPEVYFPGIGWVEFEPTGNQAPLERPETKNIAVAGTPIPDAGQNLEANPLQTPLPQEPDPTIDEGASPSPATEQFTLYRRAFSSALIILLFGFGIFVIQHYSLEDRLPVYLANRYTQSGSTPPRWLNHWVRWANLSAIERAFQAVNFSLYWMGHPQPVHSTSQERANILVTHLPSAQAQTLLLLQEYQTALYTPRTGNAVAARKAAIIILLKTWQNQIKKTLEFLDTRYNQLR